MNERRNVGGPSDPPGRRGEEVDPHGQGGEEKDGAEEGDPGRGEPEVHAVPEHDEESKAVGGEDREEEDVELVVGNVAARGKRRHAENGEEPHEDKAPAQHVGHADFEDVEQ